jgi:hypothetical protein
VLRVKRDRTKELAIEQSQRFQALDETLKLGIHFILNSQATADSDIRRGLELQTNIILGDSVQQHQKTRDEFLKGNDRIIYELHRLGSFSEHRASSDDILPVANASFAVYEKSIPTFLIMLAFPVMQDRQEQIHESYKNTFSWIFQKPTTSTRPWSDFTTWLKATDDSLYWINGKAASGKSTLMNFILGHSYTKALLSHWSGDNKLVPASFFFWNSGTPLQRSQRGLLRSLLRQILEQDPRLIPIVHLDLNQFSTSTPNSILMEALLKLCNQDEVPVKLFLLIDGLDEYGGDHIDMAILFKKISKCPNVKVCVSSRPLPVFDKAFKGLPTLQLQDLTFEDIQFYVQDKLGANEMMVELRRQEGDFKSDELLASIVEKAQGVFLWVELVVKSLLGGLTNEDTMADLQARVDALPSEIEHLYSHMLKNVDSLYRAHSSRLYQIMRAHYSPEFKAEKPLTVQEMAYTNMTLEEVLKAKQEPLTSEEEYAQFRSLELCLKTRCAGMLEVVYKAPSKYADNRGDEPSFRLPELDFQVEYIHRTARDYLAKPEIWGNIIRDAQNDGPPFKPFGKLLEASVMQLKVLRPLDLGSTSLMYERNYYEGYRGFLSMIREAMKIAEYLQREGNYAPGLVDLLDSFDHSATAHWKKRQARQSDTPPNLRSSVTSHYSDYLGPPRAAILPDPQSSMLTLSIRSGIYQYVQSKLENDINVLKEKPGRPLLSYIGEPLSLNRLPLQYKSIAGLLLENGASPNQVDDGQTPWQGFLAYLYRYGRNLSDQHLAIALDVAQIFIEHRASPSATITSVYREIDPERDKSGTGTVIKTETISCHQILDRIYEAYELCSTSNNAHKVRALQDLLRAPPRVLNDNAKQIIEKPVRSSVIDSTQMDQEQTEKRSRPRCCF